MDFLDYREKLGIGYCDVDKFKYFLQKMFNILDEIAGSDSSGCVTGNEYFSFCNVTGSYYDYTLSADYYMSERFKSCMAILDRHRNNMEDFLAYYVAFANSIEVTKPLKQNWAREHFINLLTNMLAQSHIQFDLLENDGEYFVFPKGVPEFDDALVSQPLEWLKSYPAAHRAWIKALKEYASATGETASDTADKFRKTLETFFQEFFGGGRSLEKYMSDHTYEQYLDKCGVPSDMRDEFKNTVSAYAKFINNNAKHHDNTELKVLEYLMYQTGNIIRLLITLKQEEQTDAN